MNSFSKQSQLVISVCSKVKNPLATPFFKMYRRWHISPSWQNISPRLKFTCWIFCDKNVFKPLDKGIISVKAKMLNKERVEGACGSNVSVVMVIIFSKVFKLIFFSKFKRNWFFRKYYGLALNQASPFIWSTIFFCRLYFRQSWFGNRSSLECNLLVFVLSSLQSSPRCR